MKFVLIELDLEGIRLEMPSNTPILMLREANGRRRVLPIYIGGPEASSIHFALEGVKPERPLTHDLFVALLSTMNIELENIVINQIVDSTYFAEMHLKGISGQSVVSCRPSDAVAVAIRAGTPIFATEELMDMVGKEAPDLADGSEEEILDEFRDFIDSINPEDFKG